MSILSRPRVADTVARVLGALADRAPQRPREFSDLPAELTTVAVPTRHGEVSCTVYRASDEAGRRPVHVNVHGGGFVIGRPEQDDAWCRYLVHHAGVVVVNAGYGTAPQHRFPVAPEQVHDVLRWASAPDRDWDGARLTVGGQSAGGNLATAAARRSLTRAGPAIALQVLHYPVLDMVTDPAAKVRPGLKNFPPRWMAEMFDTAYLPDPAQRRDPLASPAWGPNADDLAGIAPAVVVTAERDLLRAEAITYAGKLRAAGALLEHIDVPGVAHGYDIRQESPAETRRSYAAMAAHIAAAT